MRNATNMIHRNDWNESSSHSSRVYYSVCTSTIFYLSSSSLSLLSIITYFCYIKHTRENVHINSIISYKENLNNVANTIQHWHFVTYNVLDHQQSNIIPEWQELIIIIIKEMQRLFYIVQYCWLSDNQYQLVFHQGFNRWSIFTRRCSLWVFSSFLLVLLWKGITGWSTCSLGDLLLCTWSFRENTDDKECNLLWTWHFSDF